MRTVWFWLSMAEQDSNFHTGEVETGRTMMDWGLPIAESLNSNSARNLFSKSNAQLTEEEIWHWLLSSLYLHTHMNTYTHIHFTYKHKRTWIHTHAHTRTIPTSTQTCEYIHTHIQCPHSPAHMNVQTCTRGTYTHTNCYLFKIIFKIFDICIYICQSPPLKAQWYKQKRQKNIKNKLLWICTRIQYFIHTHNSIDAHWTHRDSSRNQRPAQL